MATLDWCVKVGILQIQTDGPVARLEKLAHVIDCGHGKVWRVQEVIEGFSVADLA